MHNGIKTFVSPNLNNQILVRCWLSCGLDRSEIVSTMCWLALGLCRAGNWNNYPWLPDSLGRHQPAMGNPEQRAVMASGGGGGGYTDLIVSVVRCYRLIGSHQPAGQHNTTSYVIITLFTFHTNSLLARHIILGKIIHFFFLYIICIIIWFILVTKCKSNSNSCHTLK